jgi:hypothetical protein
MLLAIAFICFAVQVLAWLLLPASAPEPVLATVELGSEGAELVPA